MALLLALFASLCSGAWASSVLESALLSHAAALQHVARVKRQLGPGAESQLCVLQCMQAMSSQMGSWADDPSGLISASLFSEDHLSRFCSFYKSGKRCMRNCPASATQSMLMKAFASLDYLCVQHYDELVGHLPCFRSSHVEVQRSCNPGCGDLERLKDLQKEQQMAQLLRNLDRMTHTMGEVCGILECQVNCQEPIIARICTNDTEAGQFMQGFARQSMLATERMLEDAGASRLWPEECRQLARDPSAVGAFDASDEYESEAEEADLMDLARRTPAPEPASSGGRLLNPEPEPSATVTAGRVASGAAPVIPSLLLALICMCLYAS